MAIAKQVRSHLISVLSSKEWFCEELKNELPSKWEKHGDLVVFPEKTFATFNIWMQHPDILETTCKLLQCKRLARRIGPIQSNDFRSPKIQLLFGNSTWVTKKENGILYSWDLSKCMFSSGNITEKQRIASWDLTDEVVVDMYAGIGYFTLTYLVHSKAKFVYACEWNPDAVEALKANLKLNKVSSERYAVLYGDNRETCPANVADRVNLGLIPSSEHGWATACGALRKDTGGILHVHGNIDVKCWKESNSFKNGDFSISSDDNCGTVSSIYPAEYCEWLNYVIHKIQAIFKEKYPHEEWKIIAKTVIKIKSFAPHVDHVVADILCEPC